MSSTQTLREIAEDADVTIGAGGVNVRAMRHDADYPKLISSEFTALTPGNALKMGPLRPERGTYDFSGADAIVNFGVKNDLTVRGHTLVWHNQTPEWFQAWDYTDDQLRDFLRDHVHTVAGRYHDKVDVWDVVNEGVADDGTMRESVWYDAMGEEYIDRAFEWANEVAPEADLFYNDYDADGINEKSDAIYELVQRLLDRGVPIDGVGLQMHAFPAHHHHQPDPASVGENIRRFADLGLDVHVTEMDVSYDPETKPDDHREAQAEYYRNILEACLENGCDTLTTWGVYDGISWLRNHYPEVTDDPLLFDENKDPKPAYYAIRDVLEERV